MLGEGMVWLLEPLDPGRAHLVSGLVSWHGRAMFLAWGAIVPLAVIVARYFKIMPGQKWPAVLDNKFWWHSHRRGQWLALILTFAGLIVILLAGRRAPGADLHRYFGYGVIALGFMQGVSAVLRGTAGGPGREGPDGSLAGDHYDMTRRRLIFEAVHKGIGYIAILMGIAAIVLGLWLSNAPRWMWLLIVGWWIFLAIATALLQRYRGSLDTYQAIWGPDPRHPGNRKPKQGWGTYRIEHSQQQGEHSCDSTTQKNSGREN